MYIYTHRRAMVRSTPSGLTLPKLAGWPESFMAARGEAQALCFCSGERQAFFFSPPLGTQLGALCKSFQPCLEKIHQPFLPPPLSSIRKDREEGLPHLFGKNAQDNLNHSGEKICQARKQQGILNDVCSCLAQTEPLYLRFLYDPGDLYFNPFSEYQHLNPLLTEGSTQKDISHSSHITTTVVFFFLSFYTLVVMAARCLQTALPQQLE